MKNTFYFTLFHTINFFNKIEALLYYTLFQNSESVLLSIVHQFQSHNISHGDIKLEL